MSTLLSYVSSIGVSGNPDTNMVVVGRSFPPELTQQIGNRIRIRAFMRSSGGAPIVGTVKFGQIGSEVSVGEHNFIGASQFGLLESWIHYIDNSHANIIEQKPALGDFTAINVAGFSWDSIQSLIVTQSASPGSFITVYGLFIDLLPAGVLG